MVPENKHALHGGRANPPGIAYLYLTTRPQTALAECQPWLNERISLGRFKTVRDLRVVVCDQQPKDDSAFLDPEWELPDDPRQNRLWAQLGAAFSVPVNLNDSALSYIPTQILAEVFKAEGADGIAYQSKLSHGTNLVLFDVKAAKLERQHLYTASEICYEFEAESGYAILKGKKKTLRIVSKLGSKSR